jgi:H+/Cl- antiporter ClcA
VEGGAIEAALPEEQPQELSSEVKVEESTAKMEPRWWESLVEFATHIVVGAVIFVLVAVPAVMLDILLQWLPTLNISTYILKGLDLAKKVLFGTDIVLLFVHLSNTTFLFIRGRKWK